MCVWECMLHAGTNLSTNLNAINNTICKKPKGRWMQPDVSSFEIAILGTHECYTSNPPQGASVGHFTGNCSIIYNINTTHSCNKLPTNGDMAKACITPSSSSGYTPTYLLLSQTTAVPDLFWLCGNRQLRSTLPSNWKGTCAQVALAQKTSIISDRDLETLIDMQETNAISHTRLKRSTQLTRFKDDPRVWIDEIGVPRGVPNENKA